MFQLLVVGMVLQINYYFTEENGQILPVSDGLNETDRKNIKIIDYNDIDKSYKI